MPQQPTDWVLANDHASATLISAVYDPADKNMLVAALCTFTSAELQLAIKAQLEKNNSAAYSLRAIPDMNGNKAVLMSSAGRGYITESRHLSEFHARALATTFIHKKAGDPRLLGGAFYIVPLGEQDIEDLFIDRLIVTSHLTIQREWKSYLLSIGRQMKLVSELPTIGAPIFKGCLRVHPSGWDDAISGGLKAGLIEFVE